MMIVNDKVINTLLLTLSVRERDSLLFRFWDGYTFKRMGKEFGVSKARAEAIFKKTIRKLRNPTRINYLRFHGYIKLESRFPWECDLEEKELLERLKVLEEKSIKNYPKKESRITKTKLVDKSKAVENMLEYVFIDRCHLPDQRPWMNFK